MNIKQEDLLPCLLTQQEIDDFESTQSHGLTEDDFIWFNDGETATRMAMPYMKELTELIIARKNLPSIKYFKKQLAMKQAISSVIDTNSLDQLKYFVQAGNKLLKEQLNNSQ